jgi:hypothetical protein
VGSNVNRGGLEHVVTQTKQPQPHDIPTQRATDQQQEMVHDPQQDQLLPAHQAPPDLLRLQGVLGNRQISRMVSRLGASGGTPTAPPSGQQVIQRIPVLFRYIGSYVALIETDNLTTEQLENQLLHPQLAEESKEGIRKALLARQSPPMSMQRPEKREDQDISTQTGMQLDQPISIVGGFNLNTPPKQDAPQQTGGLFGGFNLNTPPKQDTPQQTGGLFGGFNLNTPPKQDTPQQTGGLFSFGTQPQTGNLFGGLGFGLGTQQTNDPSLLSQARKAVLTQLDLVLKLGESNPYLIQTAQKLKQCISQEDLYKITNDTKGSMIAEATGSYIKIYNIFFEKGTSDQKRQENILHESSHLALSIQDVSYMYNRVFKHLTESEHQNNPDSIVRLVNSTLSQQTTENPPDTAWDPAPTDKQTIENHRNIIVDTVDLTAAVLSEVMYHIRNGSHTDIRDEYKETDEVSGIVKQALQGLDVYRTALRSTALILRYNPNAPRSFEYTDTGLILNLFSDFALDKLANESLSYKVRWLLFQISRSKQAPKKIAVWLKQTFNSKRGPYVYHSQGKYPEVLIAWSNETD